MQSTESKVKPPESSLRKWSKILLPLWGIRAGLYITARTLFRKKITVQYPEQTVKIDPSFRGKISLLFAPGSKADICINCLQCMKICPVECIHIIPKVDSNKKRHVGVFDVDLNKCLFCGLCEEVCPEYCIVLDPVYDYSSYSHEGLYITVIGLSREATSNEWRSMAEMKEKKKQELAAKRAKKTGSVESGESADAGEQ
jgi:NADH-quinone oxidoreductase chain I